MLLPAKPHGRQVQAAQSIAFFHDNSASLNNVIFKPDIVKFAQKSISLLSGETGGVRFMPLLRCPRGKKKGKGDSSKPPCMSLFTPRKSSGGSVRCVREKLNSRGFHVAARAECTQLLLKPTQ